MRRRTTAGRAELNDVTPTQLISSITARPRGYSPVPDVRHHPTESAGSAGKCPMVLVSSTFKMFLWVVAWLQSSGT